MISYILKEKWEKKVNRIYSFKNYLYHLDKLRSSFLLSFARKDKEIAPGVNEFAILVMCEV